MAAVQAMARHRLARVPYVGLTHAMVQETRAQRQQQQDGRGAGGWVYDAQDVYAVLAQFQGQRAGEDGDAA